MNDFQGSSSEDERLRRLLNDAVSDVEPRDSLEEIRDRTAGTALRARRSWILGAGTAVVATAATIAAVAVVGGSPGTTDGQDPDVAQASDTATTAPTSPEPSTPSGEPSPSGPTPDSVSSPRAEMTVPVYFIGETSRGPRLFREFRSVDLGSDRPTEAANLALADAVDPDYRSGWPDGAEVRSVTLDGGVITVDLGATESVRERPAGLTSSEASMAVQQLIYTVQGTMQEGRPAVRFLLDGQRTDTLLGVPASEPIAEGDASEVLAGVWVIDPADGATVTSPFTVNGQAEAFEATVQWELLGPEDEVVRSGVTMAAECCTAAPYVFEVTAPPGRYTLVVHDTDPSDGEGFAPWEDTKRVTVVR